MEVSVAFSGSGFKVPAHVGALAAMESSGLDIVELSGTSGGSIIAALYACGMSAAEINDLMLNVDWTELLEFNIGSAFKGSYCNGKEIYKLMNEFTDGKTFSDVDMPLIIMASDISNNKAFVFSKETTPDTPIALAVRASTAIPFVYEPVLFNDVLLVDGGVVNNIPVDRLKKEGTQKIGIQLQATEKSPPSNSNLKWPWRLASRLVSLMMDMSENTHIAAAQREGAEMIYIETGFVDGLDADMSLELKRKLFDGGFMTTAERVIDIR